MSATKAKPRQWDGRASNGNSIPASGAECIPSFNDPNENGKANAAGRFPHSNSCERLARSGLFGLETAHLLLALARQPSIDAAFQAQHDQDDRCFGKTLLRQHLSQKDTQDATH